MLQMTQPHFVWENTANSKVWDITPARPGVANTGLSIHNVTDDRIHLHVDNSGNVGIGTSSPSDKFHVDGAGAFVRVNRTDGEAGITLMYNGSNSTRSNIATQTNGDLAIDTANSESMRIDSSGNVGIGTSSPSSFASTTLEISGSSTTSDLKLTNTTTGTGNSAGFDLELNGSDINYVNRTASGNQKFWTNSTEAMRIDSSGNVLVGTTSSLFTGNHKLEIYTSNASGDSGIVIKHRDATGVTAVNAQLFVNNAGSAVGSIKMTSSSTSYNTSSDHRLKENVVELTGATTRLKQLEPKRFNFIADADTTVDGFLAHEVQSIVPEAVHGTHNEVDDDGNPVYQGIDQSKLVPLLVATIQELEARITALENA